MISKKWEEMRRVREDEYFLREEQRKLKQLALEIKKEDNEEDE